MPAIGEILVGCAENDPQRFIRQCETYAGRCVSCGKQVFVNPSAFDLMRSWNHDPTLVCRYCDNRYPDHLQRAMFSSR